MPATLSARLYSDPATFRLEREGIFGRDWWVYGHSAEVAAGEAVARTVAGWPLVVLRKPDGALRAFHNVCRHRAGPLVWDGTTEGCAKALRCRYHGWRYDLEGRLTQAPDFGEALGLEDWPLFPVRVEEARGLLHVSLDVEGPSLHASLGETLGLLPDLSRHRVHTTRAHTLRCNWKTYVENYLEGYHIPYLHPSLKAEIDVPRYAVDVVGRAAIHRVPPKEGAINEGFWAWVWPNVAINSYGSCCSIERMVPVDAGNMRIEYTYLAGPEATEAEAEASIGMSTEVTAEDVAIAEAVQRNLEAGIYTAGRLSPKHEHGVQVFQDWVLSALEEARLLSHS